MITIYKRFLGTQLLREREREREKERARETERERERERARERVRGQWDLYYTSPQSPIITFSYSLP